MILRAMEITNIRSYTDALFEFTDGVNIVVGPNASGKTNLLEAIHMSCLGKPFKSSDSDMIKRSCEWGRIDASFDDSSRTVKITRNPSLKSFIVDDIEKKRLSNTFQVPIVLFEPSHMLLLSGEPERRRSYIDGILSIVEPEFKRVLESFKRALLQRNKLLKQETIAQEDMFVWDVRTSELAGSVVDYRMKYVDVINEHFSKNYQSVSGNDESLELIYETKLAVEKYTESLLHRLKTDFQLDRLRGFTGAGPHRDDLVVMLDGNDARVSASRGETRSIVLALKIAELDIITEKTSQKPLLLLDDVFGELDGKRRRMLATTMQNHQTFITTTDADAIVKNFMESYNIITIS